MTDPLLCTAHSIRHGLVEFIANQPYTHALTLNTDRDLSLRQLRSIFGTFCAKIDRQILGRNIRQWPSGLRFNAIAVPEHLDTNPHLHAHADLRAYKGWGMDLNAITRDIEMNWRQSTRGAGSAFVTELTSEGYALYSLKEARGTDPVYFLAADFHPH